MIGVDTTARWGMLWPDATQMLALQATLRSSNDARHAFAAWMEQTDLSGDLDQGTFRILPLMYHNLRQAGESHPFMGRLKGTYRRSWYANTAVLEQVGRFVPRLQRADVPVMLHHDVPTALLHYPSHGQRVITDVGILVPAESARHAIAVLVGHGCQPHTPPSDDLLLFGHTLRFTCPHIGTIDLHWHPTAEIRDVASQRMLWDTRVELSLNGMTAWCPSPAFLLLHALTTGVRRHDTPAMQWIPDVMMFLRGDRQGIAWDAFVQMVTDHQLTHRVLLGLRFLEQHFQADLPETVFEQLSRRRMTLLERLERTSLLKDARSMRTTAWGRFRLAVIGYLRTSRRHQPIQGIVGFTHYLRFRWHLGGRRAIPHALARRLRQHVRLTFRHSRRNQLIGKEAV